VALIVRAYVESYRELSKEELLSRLVFSGMLRRVALVRTDVLEEHSASFIKVTRIGELGTTLVVTSNRRTLRRNTNGIHLFLSPS
jgi:translation initiation factor 2 beta subunit (eIF-2beta)/eIF-5